MVGLLQDQMESGRIYLYPGLLLSGGALGYLGIRWGNRFAIVVFKSVAALPDEDPCVDSSWNTYCGYPWILFTSAWKMERIWRVGKLRMRDWTESVISLVV